MRYSTPELIVLGPAAVLVLGGMRGVFDNGSSAVEQPTEALALGLDE